MKQQLFADVRENVRNNLLDHLLRANHTFYPKWRVSLLVGDGFTNIRSAIEVNDWLRDNGLEGYASANFLCVLLPDDDALAQYTLRWSNDGNL